jgi:uncharacterized protein (DUF58 family)
VRSRLSLFLTRRFFIALGADIVLFVAGYYSPLLFAIGKLLFYAIALLLLFDLVLLYRTRNGLRGRRHTPERLSNGDDNEIRLALLSGYSFPVVATVTDEIPFQFQIRNMAYPVALPANGGREISYTIRPTERGVYNFGTINAFVASPIGLVHRRYRIPQEQDLAVYPSYLQMRRYELLAFSNRLTELGIKRIRKVGHTMEFDQIRDYVAGDDVRSINWKSTARRAHLMVNQFQDERSQAVYCVIDKGRAMKLPFEGMTLLDYAINTSLVLANIVIHKQDRAGLITYSDRMGSIVPAERNHLQMHRINEVLYNQTTDFLDSNVELLYGTIRRRVSTRSLMLLFTNFETLSSLERQLPYLRKIAADHLLVVIFFQNSELFSFVERPAGSIEEIYTKTIAEKFIFEKKRIVKELARYGIHSILTTPSALTVDALNKYLELKARRMI